MVKFETFVTEIKDYARKCPPSWRFGQAIFNVVEAMYGNIAREVQFQDGVDCFYNSSEVEPFLTAVYKRLTEKEAQGLGNEQDSPGIPEKILKLNIEDSEVFIIFRMLKEEQL